MAKTSHLSKKGWSVRELIDGEPAREHLLPGKHFGESRHRGRSCYWRQSRRRSDQDADFTLSHNVIAGVSFGVLNRNIETALIASGPVQIPPAGPFYWRLQHRKMIHRSFGGSHPNFWRPHGRTVTLRGGFEPAADLFCVGARDAQIDIAVLAVACLHLRSDRGVIIDHGAKGD